MARVYNWQLGREMAYWYPESRPKKGSVVAGIDERGDAVMQVPLDEPVHVRPAYDRIYQIQRTNCP